MPRRYWLILARELAQSLEPLKELGVSPALLQHIVDSYNLRVKEMDSAVGRLALVLDPRYRDVLEGGEMGWRMILRVVSNECSSSFVVTHAQRFSIAPFVMRHTTV